MRTAFILTIGAWTAILNSARAQTTFTQVTNHLGYLIPCVFGDFDNDGFMDLLVINTVSGEVGVAQWRYSAYPGTVFNPGNLNTDRDKLVAPILFVEGHCEQCDKHRPKQERNVL